MTGRPTKDSNFDGFSKNPSKPILVEIGIDKNLAQRSRWCARYRTRGARQRSKKRPAKAEIEFWCRVVSQRPGLHPSAEFPMKTPPALNPNNRDNVIVAASEASFRQRITSLPVDMSPGARQVALLTSVTKAQASTIEPMGKALAELQALGPAIWPRTFIVAAISWAWTTQAGRDNELTSCTTKNQMYKKLRSPQQAIPSKPRSAGCVNQRLKVADLISIGVYLPAN